MQIEFRHFKQWSSMPQLGFGVWRVENDQATTAVSNALETGYRSD